MSISNSRKIQITHIINAHLFWFKYADEIDSQLDEIESDLAKYEADNDHEMYADRQTNYRSECFVGVYYKKKQKWIRAELDVNDMEIKDEVIVWATDYGFPLKTKIDLMIILSPALKEKCFKTPSNVIQGGIYGIMPATSKLNVSQYTSFTFHKIFIFIYSYGWNRLEF